MASSSEPTPPDPAPSESEPSDPAPLDGVAVSRSVVVPTTTDAVTDALLDPELLAAWIGPWEQEPGAGLSWVTTDDGITRCVKDHRRDEDGNVSWSWHPCDAPQDSSDVRIAVTPLEQQSTLVTIHEHRPSASARAATPLNASCGPAASDRWLPCVLALGAVCAQRLLVSM